MTPLLRLLLAVASAWAVSACGPIGATSVIGEAEIAVARAHTADGDRYALYETTAADLYLQKAREEQGAAHYGAAIDLADKAVALAGTATQKAAEAKRNPNATAPAAPLGQQQPAPAEAAPPRVVLPGSAPPPPPRVVMPGEQVAAPPPRPKAEPVSPDGARPDGGTPEPIRPAQPSPDAGPRQPAPPAEGSEPPRRVIKPGEPAPEEAPRQPKAPIDVEPVGEKR